MNKVCGLFLIFALNSPLLLAQEAPAMDDAIFTQCVIRNMGIAPAGGFPDLCRPTIRQNLATFVPVCIEENFETCLDAMDEAVALIAPACNKPVSNVKRSLIVCKLQLLP